MKEMYYFHYVPFIYAQMDLNQMKHENVAFIQFWAAVDPIHTTVQESQTRHLWHEGTRASRTLPYVGINVITQNSQYLLFGEF